MTGSTDPFDEMDRLFDQLTEFGSAVGRDVSVDLIEEDEAFVVVADLPGYETDDIDIQLQDGRRLTLSATRETERDTTDGEYIRRERTRQRVSRTISLPEAVDQEATEANYENGVLTIRLGKQTAEGEGTDIPVN